MIAHMPTACKAYLVANTGQELWGRIWAGACRESDFLGWGKPITVGRFLAIARESGRRVTVGRTMNAGNGHDSVIILMDAVGPVSSIVASSGDARRDSVWASAINWLPK